MANIVEETEHVNFDSSASSSSLSSGSSRTFFQAKKRTKKYNNSSQHWKRRNENEHLGDVSVSNTEVMGNTNSSQELATQSKTPHFLAQTHQGTLLDHFPKQDNTPQP